ncbi:trafficking protein particle complex subunit 10-like [Liolophura sinensis]|uniref:trafficking protein particle complex subunit 10-like n=1 Tax=Liolophura sinensis TaxID=3198878 RepID=UPI0031591E66
METKPLVTCHGDQSLFSVLHPTILQGLPRDPIEWRRSYGRPPKTVHLEASFVPFDSDILPLETDRTLVSRPFFHIYWTDCDMESYKQVVREEMMEWQAALKAKNIPDWLIVVVVNDESKLKTKLLPRSSVIDKVRSDFCNKQQDRCIVLYEPSKSEPKSLDSWGNFYQRVRQLLLQACTRTLGKYEDRMRAFREKRNEAGWSFVEYFLVQEELAFMFEMMGVFEDALVQYDELDALFTQFVLNQAAGGTADWLASFSQPCHSWAGLSLAKALDRETRDLVKQNKATLLEFRNYLFSRQCALLFLMGRPGEVAQRAMEYLHNTVQEMDILEINLPDGAVACWVFLSALEVLSGCEKYCDSSHITPYSLYTATLWDYARKKLKELGCLCGLMPGRESEPTSKQLTLVVDLLGGMGSGEETGEPKPMDKLREALSSKDTFEKHYLELSELAMGTFKHIGRLRSARLIGKDLAEFYMNRGEPQKAEAFLVDALKMFKHEGWDILAEHIRLDIAKCQEKLDNKHKLLRTACHIACCSLIPSKQRAYYQQVLTKLTASFTEEPVLLKAQSGFVVKSVTLLKPQVVKGDCMEVELCLHSKFAKDIMCDTISVAVSLQPPDIKPDLDPAVSQGVTSHKRHASRQDSSSSTSLEPIMTFHSIKSPLPAKIDIVAKTERKDTLLQTCGLMCPNSHTLLKRGDSGAVVKTESLLAKEDHTSALTAENVTLKPGINDVNLTCKASNKGVFKLNQLCVKVKGVEFLKSPVLSQTYYQVLCDDPHVDVKPLQTGSLICGIEQTARLTLYTGSVTVPEAATLTLKPCFGLTFVSADMKDNVLRLPGPAQPQCELSIPLSVMSVLPKPKKMSVDYKILLEGTWLPQGKLTATLTFVNPFKISHKLHTAKDKKFVQLLVTSETETEFCLTDPLLTAVKSQDVELLTLNRPGQSLKVTKVQKVSYLWQLKSNIAECPPLDFQLTFSYRCLLDQASGQTRQCVYDFTLDSYQTLYSLACEVLPQGDQKACRVGSACCLRLQLTHMSQPLSKATQLLYEITPDSSVWVVEGKTTGVFSSAEVPYETELQATPLLSGYLAYPFVRIHLYQPPDNQSQDVWIRQDSDEGGDISSQPSSPTHLNYTRPFSVGQVYYSSIGKQVHVCPVTSSEDVEISMA